MPLSKSVPFYVEIRSIVILHFLPLSFNMQSEPTAEGVGSNFETGSLSAVRPADIDAVETPEQSYSEHNASTADTPILRAQRHQAAMHRLFPIVSTIGSLFWYVILVRVFYHDQLTQCTSILNAFKVR